MKIPKDCKQIIINKIKHQHWQEELYLKQIVQRVQLTFCEEERDQLIKDIIEIDESIMDYGYELLVTQIMHENNHPDYA